MAVYQGSDPIASRRIVVVCADGTEMDALCELESDGCISLALSGDPYASAVRLKPEVATTLLVDLLVACASMTRR